MAGNNNSESPMSNGYTGEKRKAEDAGESTAGGTQTHTRSKRNRYISIACNECKRRKIKCNGQTPCQRCGNLNLECIYAPNCCTSSVKDSEEFQLMREQITSLQDQVNDLYANLSELRSRQDGFSGVNSSEPLYSHDAAGRSLSMSMSRTLPPLGPSTGRTRQKTALPQFHGPTSSTYGFDVAKSTLQTMGITQPSLQDDGFMSRDRSANASPFPSLPNTSLQGPPHPSKDPLWLLEQSEAIRLCRVYDEEIGIMYPHIDMERIVKHLNLLYSFINAALRTGFGQPTLIGSDAIEDDDTTVLKLVLAITLVLEGNGKSELGQRFFDSTRQAVNLKIVASLDVVSVHLIILTATFHFHKDEEAQAWRFIGIAARLCIEMGLHRKDALVKTFPNETDYLAAIRTFWVVYALDRRWSFGTGMPFALQDGDIDSFLPEPDDKYPYLRHITKYNRIAAKIWYNNMASESGENSKQHDQVGFLDYQVIQWYDQLPKSLKFNSKDLPAEMEVPGRGMRRLRFLMHLRKNQARISIYRPILHSATSIMENRHYAQNVIDVAKDQIQTITGVNQISDLYRTQQVCYNYFLVQALAVIFLAVSHAPAEFCRQTRDEFYAAIDLIRGFNAKSFVARRLWRTVRGLKEMGDKIGLLARGNLNDSEQGEQERAAVAMAGLAGHRVDGRDRSIGNTNGNGIGISGGVNGWSGGTGLRNDSVYSPEDATQIGNELTSLFELAGGYGGGAMASPPLGPDGYGQYGGQVSVNGEMIGGGEGVSAIFGNEQEFSRLMGELF